MRRPVEHPLPSIFETVARSRIGAALGDSPNEVYRIVNRDKTFFIASYNRRTSEDPRERCEDFYARLNRAHKEHAAHRGYQVERALEWPNYLALSDAGARFMNWGLPRLDATMFIELAERMSRGETATQALAGLLFPDPT